MPTLVHEAVPQTAPRLTDALVRNVQHATHRQVRELQIDCSNGTVTVSGLSRTYYVKQLVTQAILQALPSASLRNEILVTSH